MSALLTVAVVDGNGNNGVFTTASYNDDQHPRPHPPCPPSDKDWTSGWRAHHDASHVSFVVVMVVIVGAIFVSTCGMMAPKMTATATDKAVMLTSTVRKRWDTTTLSAWSNQNKNKNKPNTKSTTVAEMSPCLCLQTAAPMLTLLLPLQKQSQQQWQHRCSGGSSSSRAVVTAAHYFELPYSITITLAAPSSAVASSSLLFLDTLISI
jgi:hypothetical protein